MFGSNDNSIKIVISAKDEASKVINNIKGKVEDMQPTFKKMAIAGTAAFAAISIAVRKTVKDAAEFESVSLDFNRMVKSIGASGDELLKKLQQASAGTVDNTNLMLTANRAMALGVGNSMDDIVKLLEIARVKGRALGLDTTQAFDNIVTGIGRGSPLILDNLGIITKGWQEEADAAGVAMDKQFILNKILADGTKELESIGEVQLTTKERMAQLSAEFKNASTALGQAFIPVVTRLLQAVTPVIESIANWAKEHPALAKNITLAALAVSGLLAVVGTLGLLLPSIIAGFVLLAGPVGIIIGTIGALGLAVTKVIGIFTLLRDHSDEVWAGLKIMFKEGVNNLIGLAEGFANAWVTAVNFIIKGLNSIRFEIPKWVPKIGGKGFGINIPLLGSVVLPKFEHGGIVPGAAGEPVPILAHAGERITPASQVHSDGGSKVFEINFNNPVFRSQSDIAYAKDQFERALRGIVRDHKLTTI